MENVLSPSLAYLGKIVDTLEVERDTAFVIMPFKQPYASYYSMLYRPALESAGYRAFRAWGGLGSEDYCDLLLKLIAKCGLVWADASELSYNVLYEIGGTPTNIGHDDHDGLGNRALVTPGMKARQQSQRVGMTRNKRSPFVSWTRPLTLRCSTIS